jgi:hypothetical protein
MPESLGPGHAAMLTPMQPSAYWGNEKIWDSRVNNHNSMIDQKGRVWLAAAIRAADNPSFCAKGSDHHSAKLFPIEKNVRQISVLDPKTMNYSYVDTCFGTHHPQFGYDANNTVWASGGTQGVFRETAGNRICTGLRGGGARIRTREMGTDRRPAIDEVARNSRCASRNLRFTSP